jgi:AraC-like DNA-binding protein
MLYRKLQELTGQSPHEFISSIRFKNAARLLLKGEYTISEVAYMVGFNDPRYFSRSFRQTFNKTPTEYIKNMSSLEG